MPVETYEAPKEDKNASTKESSFFFNSNKATIHPKYQLLPQSLKQSPSRFKPGHMTFLRKIIAQSTAAQT